MADEEKIRWNTLSAEATFALSWALAETTPEALYPGGPLAVDELQLPPRQLTCKEHFLAMKQISEERARRRHVPVLSRQDYLAAIRKGLAELAERGLVAVKRGPEGTLEPTAVLHERIDFSTAMVIAGEGM